MTKPSYKGIYAITINGKSYIGQDSSILSNNRLKHHMGFLKNNNHNNTQMQDDFNEYGFGNLTYTILTLSLDYTKEDLNRLEKEYINKFNTYELGYNQTIGGIGMSGFEMSPETLEKKSIQLRGEKNPQSKLTNNQFFEMVELFKEGKSNSEIAEIFGLHDRYVSLIRHKKRFTSFWDQVVDYEPIQSHSLKDKRKFSYEDFLEVIKMIENGSTNKEIEKRFSASSGTGSRIRHKKLYIDYWKRYEAEKKHIS
ncbi:nuclease [Metabacillus sp. Hm71]|uniref:nuclease n=1 Tax=Metabacillus sp. Hm71 TaxID=3450743 RepID=UPI003F43C3FF